MEALPREHLERLIFFEHVREQAEQEYRRNDKDAENLTRWGGALLELAHFRQGPDALELVIEAEKRLDEALKIEADKHDALWCMGNCLTAQACSCIAQPCKAEGSSIGQAPHMMSVPQGFMYTEPSRAGRYFERARNCFAKALEKDPSNELYKKSLDSCAQGRKKKSTLKYDIIGWVVLTGLVVTFIAMSKNAPAR
eukprot:jgi/Chlat1/1173/Chrsp113S01643